MNLADLSQAQYGLLFDVRRSIRYHDRRRTFFEQLHRITGVLTFLLAGSVLFEVARPGESAAWLVGLSVVAALLAACDTVAGYASRANQHHALKSRFIDLEREILGADPSNPTWVAHQVRRLEIERDEPPVYRALDLLCHNELARAEGCRAEEMAHVGWLARLTSQFLHWPDLITPT